MPPGSFKPTLQLRHQLTCSGIAIDAAAYDARRHHLLTYGSHALKPHTLRLFSLRREIRSTPLFDGENEPPPLPPPSTKTSKPKVPSVKEPGDPIASTVLRFISLFYALELDVFVCVYSAYQHLPSHPSAGAPTGYSVVVLEPASLKKLVVYSGPRTHLLRCACLDEPTGRLVLASRVAGQDHLSIHRKRPSAVRVATTLPTNGEEDRSNVVEMIEIYKRPFRHPTSVASTSRGSSAAPVDRVMLCVERLPRATLWHSDPLDCIAASPRVCTLFGAGAAYDDDGDEGDDPSVVLEWRENAEGTLTLARRIFHEHNRVTTLATTRSGQWLFTGHANGVLKVWAMAPTACSKDDDHPPTFAPAIGGEGALFSHQSAVATIEFSAYESKDGDAMETAMLYTTEQASGRTRHWRFRASAYSTEASTPQLDCLGHLDVDPTRTEVPIKKKKKRARGGALGDWTRTIALCIAVQMGSYTENLLVVTRGDMIHVIKIQTLVQVIHDVARGDKIFGVESLPRRDGSAAILCFSGTTSFHQLQISGIDPQSAKLSAPHEFCLPPPMQVPNRDSIRLTRLHVGSSATSGESWIVCGWSTGVVEVYTEQQFTPRRIALLQDPRLDVEITSLAIVNCQGVAREKAKAEEGVPSRPAHSWGGLLKSDVTIRGDHDPSVYSLVVAGTARGAIFGWRFPDSTLNYTAASVLILDASIAVDRQLAHSAHVVDLIALSSESKHLLSMGADGILKLWALPAMQLQQHINAAASSGATGTRLGMLCSCVQVLNGGDAIAVGYEDGAIGVWQAQGSCASSAIGDFVELHVSGRHGRHVSAIVTAGENEFLTASLDMTIVLWAIAPNKTQVDELRFFELGEPILDCCAMGGIVLVGLSNEVCWFAFDEDTKKRTQSCSPSPQEIVSQAEVNAIHDVEEDTGAVSDEAHPEDSSPGSPTPRTSTGQTSLSEREDSVNSTSIPSVVVPRSATIRQDSLALHCRSSRSGRLEGWQTDQTNDSPMDAEVLALYVRQYVTSCGVAGTIVAESLSHFLSVYHLPWCKRTRPDFFIRKYLFECKIDPKTRLTADETTALLLDLQRTAEPAHEDEMPEKTTKPSSGKRRAALKRLAGSRKKANRIQNKSMNDKVAVVTYNIFGEKSIKWVPCSQSTSNQEAGRDVIPLSGDAVSVDGGHCHQRRRGRRKEPSPRTVMAPLGHHLPNGDLLGRVHLSSSFQPMWTRGFCWCLDSQCIVQWDKSAEKNKNSPDVICSKCGHQRHTLHLQRKTYKPHFTARTILGIIAEVYEMMTESAHEVLYRNGDTAVSSSQEFSIHAALWKLFQHRFGVQKLVETKLKLLFVSMCHLVREMDAIAVFGELLALFQRAEHDEQVPHKLVALCVVTHGWLYAREMVVNGDPIWGNTEASNGVNASSKATHWQFVSLSNALFCAQEILVYPLVSPGYLQNILLYMEDYAQQSPTKPGQETVEEEERDAGTRWIDIHRLLRLLVGEWKQQMTEFRGVERLLFSDPVLATQDSAPQDSSLGLAAVLEKLRLILSCFVFYDNERVGLTELSDFENILRRLKYLWPNEHLSEEEAAGANRFQDSLTFENTIIAARRRFGDTQGDGRICYLDFWAMLYIAGVRTKSLLKFREIPSFCKDYRLEVSSDLREMLSVFMQRSSALLLPRGFQTANNSVNEATRHEHQRRVGGLYDGVYIVDTNATHTLSMQQLLRDEPYSATDGLYIDGAIPAMHQSASTTTLDGFGRGKVNGSSGWRPREPVVVGIRPIGPHPKPIGVLSVSSLGLAEASDTTSGEATRKKKEPAAVESRKEVYHAAASPLIGPPDSYASVYIRFPNVAPRKTDVDFASAQHSRVRSLAGSATCDDNDDEAMTWQHHFLEEHEHDEQERRIAHEERLRRLTLQKEHAAMLAVTQHTHDLHASPPKKPSPTKPDTVVPMKYSPQGETCRRVDATTEAARPALTKLDEPVVVVPTVEAHPETNPLPGSSPTVPKRRRPQADTESEPVVGDVMIHPKEMAPVVIEVNSPHVGPRDVNSDVVITEELKEATLGDPSLLVSTPDDAHATLWPRFDRSTTSGIQISTPAEEGSAIEGGEEGHEDQDEDNLSEEDVSDAGGNSEDELGSDSNDEQEEENDDSNISVAEASPKVMVNQTAQVVAHEDVTSTSTSAVSEEMSIAQLSSLVETPTRGEQTPTLETVIVVAEGNAPSQQAVSAKKPLARKPSVVQRDVPIGQPGMVATQSASKQTTSSSASPGKAVSPSPTFAIPSSLPRPKSKPTTAELRHRFRFSQQPKFKLSAALVSNPLRSKQWKPLDGSDSDDESELSPGNGLDDNDDTIDVDDMALRLSRRSLVVLRKEFGRKTSVARTAALAAAAFSTGGLSRRGRRGSYETNENFISEEDSSHHHGTSNPVRLNEDVERALYGDRARHYLGEGIAFSADAEAHMQHKWQDFFGTAEATMFSPLKEAIKQREEAQRQQDERQSRLMKKRMEQQHLDTMRLRRNTTILAADAGGRQPSDVKHDTAGNFRARRLTRESCLQAHQRLILGETASGELHAAHATLYFHFEYAPDAITGGYSIITFKLHVVQGEADLFLSTQTTAPCSSDFMWRSAETCVVPTTNTAVAVSDGEGQKIVLFPHDVARLCGRGTVTSVVFYMAVEALAPHTSFTLGVMTTGQKAAPSRAIQTVDNLIAHFNQLAKTYEGQASRRRNLATDLPTTSTIVRASSSSGVTSADRLRALLASAASMDSVEGDDEEGGGSEKDINGRRRSSQQLRRQSTVGKSSDPNSFVADSGSLGFVRNDGEHEDTSYPSDVSSFQQLLESFGQKHRLGLPHSQSLVLGDAMSEQREFLHDEEVSYRDTKARLASPLKNRTFAPGTADTNATLSERSLGEDDGTTMAVAVVTERRLSTTSSLALQQRLGARLKQRLSPLKASRKHGESASLRVARSEPKLVAYSLSSLPPPKHALHQLQLGAVAPVSRPKNKR